MKRLEFDIIINMYNAAFIYLPITANVTKRPKALNAT